MKYIYLIRHAKSSWDDFALDDFDRPLNERGKRDAPVMAKRLQDNKVSADLWIASPAKRAFSTAKRMAETLGINTHQIQTDKRLYHASPETTLKVIHEVSNTANAIFLFAHNPGLTEAANQFMQDRTFIENIPTCGIAAFSFDVNDWTGIAFGKGKLLFFDFPKRLTEE